MWKIPFKYLPAAWGLSGITRQIAEIEYTISDKFLREMAVAEVMHHDDNLIREQARIKRAHRKITDFDYEMTMCSLSELPKLEKEMKRLDIRRKYADISEFEYYLEVANIKHTGKDLERAVLKAQYDFGQIDQFEYNKRLSSVNGKGWVRVLDIEMGATPAQGAFNLDWNSDFIVELKEAGYAGATDEDIVNDWLCELCKNIALEQYSGVGSFDEDVGAA